MTVAEYNGLDGRRLVGIYFVILSFLIMTLVWASRSAWSTPPVSAFGLAWLYCAAAVFAWQTLTYSFQLRKSLVVFLTFAVMALPCIAGGSLMMGWFIDVVLFLIVAYGIYDATPTLRRISVWDCAVIIGMAPLLAIVLFLWVNTLKYANVLEPELALFGMVHVDTMYHSAISSMFTQHGVISTGADGLVRTPYHALSHLWIGRLSEWLGTTPIHGYYLVIQIIGIPLVLYSLVVCTWALSSPGCRNGLNFSNILLFPMCLLLLVAIGDWNSFLNSESHTLGMLLFMLGLPLLFELAKDGFSKDPFLRLAVILGIGVLMIFAKISVGAIWFGGLGYIVLRHLLGHRALSGSYKWLIPIFAIAAILIFVFLLSILPQEHLDKLRLAPFKFSKDEWLIVLINTVPMIIAAWLIRSEIRKSGQDIALELLLAQMAGAWVITNLVDLPGGSSYYFLTVGTWVALAAVGRCLLQDINIPNKLVLRTALIVLILVPIAVNSKIRRGYGRLHGLVETLADLEKAPKPSSLFATDAMAKQLPNAAGAQFVNAIFSQLSYGEADVAIFVPPSNKEFWNLNEDCRRKSFLIPSITGIPMLNGLPPADLGCGPLKTHGFLEYNSDSLSREMSDIELCKKSNKLGFGRVGVLETLSQFRILTCSE
jgi:hypothetical protein